jgi:hypothetical protein
MSKGKELTSLIPRIYKKNAENMMLFCWIKAQKQIIPTITLEQAIWNYFRFYGIETWDMECARTSFERMQKEYIDDCNL